MISLYAIADGSKTKLDVRFISTHRLTPIRGSLIHFTYDLVFSTMRDKESCDFNETTRVYLHRANMLMPLLRLMRNRATNLFKWAKTAVYHIVKLHREPELRTYIVSARGRRLSISVFPEQLR